jgi:hypothetical protein
LFLMIRAREAPARSSHELRGLAGASLANFVAWGVGINAMTSNRERSVAWHRRRSTRWRCGDEFS